MTYLLEFKERFKKFYNRYNTIIVPAARFLVALISFIMVNASIGYMEKLKNPVFAILLSIVCAFLPGNFTLVILSVFMLIHLYAISAEFALLTLCVILLMYLFYFRFAPKTAYVLIITAMLCWMQIPFAVPVVVGLCYSVFSVIPVGFGVIIYYIVRTASDYEAAISNQSLTESMQQITYLVESLLNNKQMIVMIIAAVITIAVVYIIRRLKVDYAWRIAIAAGSVVEFLTLIIGQIALKSDFNVVVMILGVLLGAVAAFLCNVIFFAIDYKRTEYVQYEDDEYYYYVKAVPKINVATEDVKVKHINAKKTKRADDIRDMRNRDMKRRQSQSTNAVAEEEEEDILYYDDDKND